MPAPRFCWLKSEHIKMSATCIFLIEKTGCAVLSGEYYTFWAFVFFPKAIESYDGNHRVNAHSDSFIFMQGLVPCPKSIWSFVWKTQATFKGKDCFILFFSSLRSCSLLMILNFFVFIAVTKVSRESNCIALKVLPVFKVTTCWTFFELPDLTVWIELFEALL